MQILYSFRLELVTGALQKYRNVVRQKNVIKYDPIYPIISNYLENVYKSLWVQPNYLFLFMLLEIKFKYSNTRTNFGSFWYIYVIIYYSYSLLSIIELNSITISIVDLSLCTFLISVAINAPTCDIAILIRNDLRYLSLVNTHSGQYEMYIRL